MREPVIVEMLVLFDDGGLSAVPVFDEVRPLQGKVVGLVLEVLHE